MDLLDMVMANLNLKDLKEKKLTFLMQGCQTNPQEACKKQNKWSMMMDLVTRAMLKSISGQNGPNPRKG